jgi:UDP-N-acetylmuramoyl-tripeptide--D-alanyl-D-alanine ligase
MTAKLQKIVALGLKRLAQATVLRYKPAIVGVTGSAGKTSTVLAVTAALSGERRVRAPYGNFNGDIGLPLTILGDWAPEELKLFGREYGPGQNTFRKIFFLIKVMAVSAYRLAVRAPYPEVLVLEYGVDRPGDMRRLVAIARPNVAVMTAVGDTPAHVENFGSPQDVVREKSRLIECLPSAGAAVLNADDAALMGLTLRTRAEIMTFGMNPGATVSVESFEHKIENNIPTGITFKLRHAGATVPIKLSGALGSSHAYAAAAAASVGLIFGLNLVSICESLEKRYRPAAHRMQLLPGIKSSLLIDDSYNASPISMRSALETLKSLPAKRRVAVLGDMLEIGEYAMEAHEKTGRLVAGIADILVLVGPRAKFIGEGAKKKGFAAKDIYSFETADEARATLQDLIVSGDLVLIKGSHAVGLEALVNEVKGLEAVSEK